MPSDDRAYHLRRAETQRLLGERADNPAIAIAHRALADLHTKRARECAAQSRSNILSLFS